MYDTFGAHVATINGRTGVHFAVWAPNAIEVSILANDNGWTAGYDKLSPSDSGVWTGFVAGMKHGAAYKFGIRTREGNLLQKADPVAFRSELRPRTASIVYELGRHVWSDQKWMKQRAESNWFERPISIYEVHLGSWKKPKNRKQAFNYRELAKRLVEYCQQLGYTHLQLMPPTEHPLDGSWGYQTTGFFAPTSRYGTPRGFMQFVDDCHQAGIGVFIDWVPDSFPIDAHGLACFDGTNLYEHADPRLGIRSDRETCKFKFGRTEVRDFLINSARFWLDKYHVDGIRIGGVASMLYSDGSREDGEWIPNQLAGHANSEAVQFLKDFNTIVHGEFPGVLTIAEESSSWEGVSRPVHHGGLGFSMKLDTAWMNDTLRYIRRDSMHRSHHQDELSFRMGYAFNENYILPLSHDEVVHGKRSLISQMPGDYWQKFANLRLLYGYQHTTPGKKLLFMGGEIAQWDEWDHEDELDWPLVKIDLHAGLQRFVGDLNRIYRDYPAMHQLDCVPEGFEWIQYDDQKNSAFAFLRYAHDRSDFVVVIMSFSPLPHEEYRIGVPLACDYVELMNSDAEIYGGGNVGNLGRVESDSVTMHGHDQSLSLSLPPLGIMVLKPVADGA